MTTFETPPIDFAALDREYEARANAVATHPTADDDFERFVAALLLAMRADGSISQNDVRPHLFEQTLDGPRCAIHPNKYSAFFGRARKAGLIVQDGHDICTTSPTGNNNKMQRRYRWVAA